MYYENLEDFESFVNKIIKDGIDEIHRKNYANPNWFEYTFKIDSKWYNISINDILGTTFRLGKSIVIRESFDSISWKMIAYHQNSKRYLLDNYMNKFNDLYAKSIILNHESIKVISTSFSELMDRFNYIEKFNDNLYVLGNNTFKYSISLINTYNSLNNSMQNNLIVKKGQETVYKISDDNFSLSIMKYLEALYISTKIRDVNSISSFLKENLK